MQTEIEITEKILRLTNEMKNKYPELLKYIAEIPVKDVFETDYEINNKHLLDYYNTLKIILEKYEKEHSPNKNS